MPDEMRATIREAQAMGYHLSHTRGRGEAWEAWARDGHGHLAVMSEAPDLEGAYREIREWLRRIQCQA